MSRILDRFCLGAVLATSAALIGQTTNAQGRMQYPNATDSRCSISGRVVNSVTGEGISRAQVTMYGNEARATLADGEGRFSFEDVAPVFVGFQARKPGFTSPVRRVEPRIQPCASNAPELKVLLVPTAAITGHIKDPNGEPVDNIPVRLGKYDYRDGLRHFTTRASDNTDSDGKFRIAGLEAGSYVVIVGPSAPQMVATLRDVAPISYYPGVPDRASASSIEVKAGATVDLNMVVKEGPGYKISGRVLGASPELRGVSVELKNDSDDQVGVMIGRRGDPNEFTVIGVPSGNYRLHAIGYEPTGPMHTGTAHVVVSHDLSNVQISIAPLLNLQANVRTETEDNVQPAGIAPLASVRLIPVEGDGSEYSAVMRNPKSPKLTVNNVEPGTYLVSIDPNGRGYVQSARLGNVDLLRDRVLINSDQEPIEITLRNDGAQLSGTAPVGAMIVAVPSAGAVLPPRTGAYPNFENSSEGKYQMTLAPGEYTLYAFSADGVEYSNPKVLEKYSAQGVQVSLSARDKKEVTLKLIEVLP